MLLKASLRLYLSSLLITFLRWVSMRRFVTFTVAMPNNEAPTGMQSCLCNVIQFWHTTCHSDIELLTILPVHTFLSILINFTVMSSLAGHSIKTFKAHSNRERWWVHLAYAKAQNGVHGALQQP